MIVLDTNVVSDLMLPRPTASVIEWIAEQAAPSLYLSTISEAELRYGVEILPIGQRRQRLLAEIEGMLREDFAGRILPFDSYAAHAYAVVAAARRAAGRPINHADCQIAAIARSHRASIATRDVKDFEGCGIEVINPWSTD
jgi:predicted nucleic acid-binding protein